MHLALDSPARKASARAAVLLLTLAYITLITTQFLGAHFSTKIGLSSLRRAAVLVPGNAEYRDLLGNYLFLVQRSPESALAYYRNAVSLNPGSARYWFDLSSAYAALGDEQHQLAALGSAVLADPRTPELAWDAANTFLTAGHTRRAMHELKAVVENDPALVLPALRLSRNVADTQTILREVMPSFPQPYYELLELLMQDRQLSDAAQVWAQLSALRQPIDREPVFAYVRFLLAEHDVDQASGVWQQAGNLAGLASYQPSPQNLIINGDFGLDILNGGFGWLYSKSAEVSLALDPAEHHTSHRSLRIMFDSSGIDDAGIRQPVVVQSDKTYEFSAFYKAAKLEGAGGVHLSVLDAYSGTPYFVSETLTDADYWKPCGGKFTTTGNTRLVTIAIQRIPAGHPLRGTLWIDGLQMAEVHP